MALPTRCHAPETISNLTAVTLRKPDVWLSSIGLLFLARELSSNNPVFTSLFGIAFAPSLTNQKSGCLVRANETGTISGLYEKATDSAV